MLAAAVAVAAPPSAGETCLRSVDAAAPSPSGAEADLRAALVVPGGSGCADWRVELAGTFPLTDTLVWDAPIPLHLVGPAAPAGATARLEGSGNDHRLLTLGGNAGTAAMTLERLVLTGGDVGDVLVLGGDQGGAIDAAVLTLIDVELIGNRAVIGGAVVTLDLTATRTSFIDNVAEFDATVGDGGAVLAYGAVALTNVTFRGNTAVTGGALLLDGTAGVPASLAATNVTFLGNRSGAAGGGAHLALVGTAAQLPVTLRGVLLGAAGGGSAGPLCDGSRFAQVPLDITDTVPVSSSLAAEAGCGVTVDPDLATLVYGSVPFRTGTTALPLPPSDWGGIDRFACAAADGWPTTDQRGVTRPQGTGDRCDVGAVEREVVVLAPPPPPPPAPDPADAAQEPDAVGPVPRSVPAGGGGCADGCPPLRRPAAVPAPQR